MPDHQTQIPGVENFTGQEEVQECLKKLRTTFHEKNPLIVSDVLDKYGNQYVNLVQKGGGVLGIALVGYTYILEQMGIRFLRLAGTSAGAINTAFMVAIDEKGDAKSERIIELMNELNLFDLVDGHPVARWLIKSLVKPSGENAALVSDQQKNGRPAGNRPSPSQLFARRLKALLLFPVVVMAASLAAGFILLGLEKHYDHLIAWTQTCFALAGFALFLIIATAFYINRLLARFKGSGFGINPGVFFLKWVQCRFEKFGVYNVSELDAKAAQPIEGLQLRVEHEQDVKGLKGDVTFIASELVTGNKILFPQMKDLFFEPSKIDEDARFPAGFVRASMSIPLFFESFFINNIPVESEEIQNAWMGTFNRKPPRNARLVDGGLLSNFPISLFFNPKLSVPRLPTFGIDLDDSSETDEEKDSGLWGLQAYLGRMLGTLRGYYDKDFLLQNKAYEKGIGKVRLGKEFNWLNFFLTEEEKQTLFVRGAEAATEFLLNFNWEAYKEEQSAMRKEVSKTKPTEK